MESITNRVLIGLLVALFSTWIFESIMDTGITRLLATLLFGLSIFAAPVFVSLHPAFHSRGLRFFSAIAVLVVLPHILSWSRTRTLELPDDIRRSDSLARLIEPGDNVLIRRTGNTILRNGPFEVGYRFGSDYELHILVPFSWTAGKDGIFKRIYTGTAYFVVTCEFSVGKFSTTRVSLQAITIRPSRWPTSFIIGWFETMEAWERLGRLRSLIAERVDAITSS